MEPIMRTWTEVLQEFVCALPSVAVALTETGASVSLRVKKDLSREREGATQLSEAKETGVEARTVEEKGATERVTLTVGRHSMVGLVVSGKHSQASPTPSWS